MNRPLVAWNKARRQHHDITRFNLYQLLRVARELGQCGQRFALATAYQKGEATRLQKLGLKSFYKGGGRKAQLPSGQPEPHTFCHPQPERHYIATCSLGDLSQLANPMQMR